MFRATKVVTVKSSTRNGLIFRKLTSIPYLYIMYIFLSFLRRLKIKTAFYFALPLSLVFWGLCVLIWSFAPDTLIPIYFFMVATLLVGAWAVRQYDRKQKTGIRCRICDYGHCVLLYPARRKHKAMQGSFACSSFDHGEYPDIYYCPECRNGFLINIADQSFEKTKEEGFENYKNVADLEYIKNIAARHMTYRRILKDYQSYFENKKVLEIGSYYGAFAEVVQNVAGQYTGIEPSTHATEYAQKKYPKLKFHNGNVEKLLKSGLLKDQFDTIVLFDVIEHLPDPITTLKELRPFLKPGGDVLFSTINIESSFSQALGPRWPWFMDMHYYYFSDRGYYETLERAGFKLTKHAHFPYLVPFSYFLQKVFSMLSPKFKIPASLEKPLAFPVPIKLGDTVMIVGQSK
ncbi:MAG: methyltransferase domain-containing protein [Bdellovibrionales bacterium]